MVRMGLRTGSSLIRGSEAIFLVDLGIATRLFEFTPPPANSTYSSDSGGPTIIANRLTPHGWWVALRGAVMLGAGGVLAQQETLL